MFPSNPKSSTSVLVVLAGFRDSGGSRGAGREAGRGAARGRGLSGAGAGEKYNTAISCHQYQKFSICQLLVLLETHMSMSG